MLIAKIEDKKFRLEHLLSSPNSLNDIKSFYVEKQTGKGLERYIWIQSFASGNGGIHS